jgi:hypothetical protein
MDSLQQHYEINKIQEPVFHLGCDYRKGKDGYWFQGTVTYVKECLSKVESILGRKLGKSAKTPSKENEQLELDDSDFLSTKEHRNFQQLAGIAQWLCTCGRFDLIPALNNVSRFSAAPRAKHMDAAIRIFEYLNCHKEKWIKLSPEQHQPASVLEDPLKGKESDWSDMYDVQGYDEPEPEQVDFHDPEPNGTKGLDITVYFDSNHAHDVVTRRSVSGIIVYVGSCPVFAVSKRQGAIATSTYSAEMCAAKVGVDEAINMRVMLRSMGVPIKGPTKVIGDNLGQLQSVTNPGTPCKNKSNHIAYHFIREAVAKKIVQIWKIDTHSNISDLYTKALGNKLYHAHVNRIFSSPYVHAGA